ncbi:MAG: hypothetical protein R6U52_01480 [Kosmotogaceae bacterium]
MNEEPNVSGETINQEAAVPTPVETGDNQSVVENQEVQQEEQSENVPLSALQAERSKRQQVEERLRMVEDHLALNQAQQSKPQPKDEFEGLDEGDVMTVGDFKKLSSKMANQFQMTLEELKMTQKHPDYQEVITKYLPDVLKQNPGLKHTLQKTQDYELAYYLAKNSDTFRKENKKSKKSADAQRIVENSQRAGSLSSTGATSPISQAKRYKDMSDKEFMELMNKNMG